MFQFPPLALCNRRVSSLQDDGLSHSEIRVSKIICIYTRLIAAYHVLHRLCEPRHPPCALSYFLAWLLFLSLPFQVIPKITAHTFSCISLVLLFYSLSCVNMSKISLMRFTKLLSIFIKCGDCGVEPFCLSHPYIII